MTPDLKVIVARLRELEAAATPAPWTGPVFRCSGSGTYIADTDVYLIAESRNALPKLLDEVEVADAAIARLTARVAATEANAEEQKRARVSADRKCADACNLAAARKQGLRKENARLLSMGRSRDADVARLTVRVAELEAERSTTIRLEDIHDGSCQELIVALDSISALEDTIDLDRARADLYGTEAGRQETRAAAGAIIVAIEARRGKDWNGARVAELEAAVLHPGDGTCDACGSAPAAPRTLCLECLGGILEADQVAKCKRLNQAQGEALIALKHAVVCDPEPTDLYDDLQLAKEEVLAVAAMKARISALEDTIDLERALAEMRACASCSSYTAMPCADCTSGRATIASIEARRSVGWGGAR